jgi:hypothetical protein
MFIPDFAEFCRLEGYMQRYIDIINRLSLRNKGFRFPFIVQCNEFYKINYSTKLNSWLMKDTWVF